MGPYHVAVSQGDSPIGQGVELLKRNWLMMGDQVQYFAAMAAGETKPLRCCRPLPGRLSAGYPVAAEQTVSRVLWCNESLTAAVSP